MKKYKVILENGTSFVLEGHTMSSGENGIIKIYPQVGNPIAIIPASACVYEVNSERK